MSTCIIKKGNTIYIVGAKDMAEAVKRLIAEGKIKQGDEIALFERGSTGTIEIDIETKCAE